MCPLFLLSVLIVPSAVCSFGTQDSFRPLVSYLANRDVSALAHPSGSQFVSEISTASSSGPPFQLSHIDHIVIRCQNFPLMFDFYHRILGCTIDEPQESHVNRFGGALTHLRAGSCYIDLLAYDTDHLIEEGREAALRIHAGGAGLMNKDLEDVKRYMSSETSTLDHLCIRIEPFDKQQLISYLEEKNVVIVKRDTAGDSRLGADGVGPSVYVRDPEGNVIELKGSPYKDNDQRDNKIHAKNNSLSTSKSDPDDVVQKASKRDTEKEGLTPKNDPDIAAEKSNDTTNRDTVPRKTPCNRICRYNSSFYDGKVCIGCFREEYEIEMWQSSSPMQKAMTLLDAIDRLSDNNCPSDDSTEQIFDGAITKEELQEQYTYWSDLAKI